MALSHDDSSVNIVTCIIIIIIIVVVIVVVVVVNFFPFLSQKLKQNVFCQKKPASNVYLYS